MDRKVAYANALAAAFVSDLNRPEILDLVRNGSLTRSQFTRIVNRDVARGIEGAPGSALFPALRAFARQVVDIGALARARAAGLSADTSAIGGASSLAGAIAGAVGAIWGSKIVADANKDLAKISVQQAQIAQNSQEIAARSALIQNATANGLLVDSTGQVVDPLSSGPIAALKTPIGIAIATAALATLVGGFYALKG